MYTVIDSAGRTLTLEDDEPCPPGCSLQIPLQFLDAQQRAVRDACHDAGTYIHDPRERAYLNYCDRLANAHRAGRPRGKPLSDAEYSGTSRVAWAKARIARQQAHKHP